MRCNSCDGSGVKCSLSLIMSSVADLRIVHSVDENSGKE